jgi:hypothetical protein
MKTQTNSLLAVSAALAFLFAATSCEREDIENRRTIKDIYKSHKGGAIWECSLNGETVYKAEMNATDIGSQIYNSEGEQIGYCSWSHTDSICADLTDCECFYMGEDNIWGYPPVDKYNLER